jgi:hypothetical protein
VNQRRALVEVRNEKPQLQLESIYAIGHLMLGYLIRTV